jgi:pyruvate carboxylase
MFSKALVANRGEITIRAFRAEYELGAQTVAVFPFEDRNSVHRMTADEAYQIGAAGHPVRNHLSVEEIVAAAVRSGADAVYPGYGFLSENPDLAALCAAAGITCVGPSADVLELTCHRAPGPSLPVSFELRSGRDRANPRPRRRPISCPTTAPSGPTTAQCSEQACA